MKNISDFIIKRNKDRVASFVLKGKKKDENYIVYVPDNCVKHFYYDVRTHDTKVTIKSPKTGNLKEYYCKERGIFFGNKGNIKKSCPRTWQVRYGEDFEEFDETTEKYKETGK